MSYVLIVRRKGDVQLVVTSEDQARLQAEAARMDGHTLSWQDFWGTLGAHSGYDGEKSYSIFPATGV